MSASAKASAGPDAQPLARAAQRFADRQARVAEASRGEQRRQGRRCPAIPGQRQDLRVGPQVRHDALERPPVQGDADAVLQRPAEPGGEQAEGGGLRITRDLGGGDEAGEHAADAVAEGIAAREYADRRAAPREEDRIGLLDRRRPDALLARRRPDQREMPPAAHDERGLGEGGPRGPRQAVQPILPDPHESQPAGHEGAFATQAGRDNAGRHGHTARPWTNASRCSF